MTEGGTNILHGGPGGDDLGHGFGKLRIVASKFFEVLLRCLEGGFGGSVVFVEYAAGAESGGLEFFGVGEDTLLGGEGFVFAGLRRDGLNFPSLEAPEVGEAKTILLIALEIGEAVLDCTPARESIGDGIARRVGLEATEAVEERALLGRIEAGESFALGVDEGQLGCELAQDGDGGRLVVDVDTPFAIVEDFAAKDDLSALGVNAVGIQHDVGAGGALENTGKDGAVGTVTDEAGRGFLAEKEREGIDQNGFACTRFSGEQIEAGAEASDGVVDDSVILGPKFEQHGSQGTGYRVQRKGCSEKQQAKASAGSGTRCAGLGCQTGTKANTGAWFSSLLSAITVEDGWASYHGIRARLLFFGEGCLILVMHEPIRVGVVGFGLAGKIFHTSVIEATPGLELVCVVQRSGDEAAREYPHAKQAHSVEEMLGDVGIQLVVIATPSYSHFELARQCLREQRNVVVDKPFTLTSAEAAELIRMARERKLLLTVYQNRRWDGGSQTLQQVIASGELGRVVSFESHFDRFREMPRRDVWRENGGPGGGILFDLGPHLIDEALTLFGIPDTIYASVRVERENAVVDDAWDIVLEYTRSHRMIAMLRSTLTACTPGPRYVVHGARGSYSKWGIDPQEDQLKSGMQYDSPELGVEPESAWGELRLCGGGATRLIPTLRGDYRGFYENVRDTMLGKAELVVKPEQAWQTTRLIELARESSAQGRRLRVDFDRKP